MLHVACMQARIERSLKALDPNLRTLISKVADLNDRITSSA
jgi:hypothetical protein